MSGYQRIPDTPSSQMTSFEVESSSMMLKYDSNASFKPNKSLLRVTYAVIALVVAFILVLGLSDISSCSDYEAFTILAFPCKSVGYLTHNGLYLVSLSNSSAFRSEFPIVQSSSLYISPIADSKTFHILNSYGFKLTLSSTNTPTFTQTGDNTTSFIAVIDSNSAEILYIKVANRPIWLTVNQNGVLSTSTIQLSIMNSVMVNIFSKKVNIKSLSASHSYKILGFGWKPREMIRGVNLGGWFIPEVWMRRSFFNGTGLGWGGSLCGITKYNKELSESRIMESLKSWINESDFEEIASYGFNSVRLPIGYWNVVEDPFREYAPSNMSISLSYIDKAFEWAARYGLSVLVDLHGLPGSQNGLDHSGCSETPTWLEDQQCVDLSLAAVKSIVDRYSSHSAFIGIELANEPGYAYSTKNHTELLMYYQQAYSIVRKASPSAYVIFNELYDTMYHSWTHELREPEYYNVIMDIHLYDWQEPYTSGSKNDHIRDAEAWRYVVDSLTKQHPVLVGEWSMSTGTHVQAGQTFVDAATRSYSSGGAIGWYLWNWKIERGLGFDEWDVQLQMRRGSEGLNPLAL